MSIDNRPDKKNVANIHHGILCSHENDEFVSFVGTWVNLETIILRIHGHREGSITHWGLLRGAKGGTVGWGCQSGITWGEMPDVGDGGLEAANHIAMCVPMQQSCMIYTCNPEPKVQY